MVNTVLLRKAIDDSNKSIQQVSDESGVPVNIILDLCDGKDDNVSVVVIQAIARVTGMSENMRRNTFCMRDLPLD